jgi:hypothetical protein
MPMDGSAARERAWSDACEAMDVALGARTRAATGAGPDERAGRLTRAAGTGVGPLEAGA